MWTKTSGSLNFALNVWYTQLSKGAMPEPRSFTEISDGMKADWQTFLDTLKDGKLSRFKILRSNAEGTSVIFFQLQSGVMFELCVQRFGDKWRLNCVNWEGDYKQLY